MKKLVITLVIASLYSGASFAQGAKKVLKEAEGLKGKQEIIQPKAGAGAKVNAAGAVNDNAQSAGKQKDISAQSAAAQTGMNSHYTCPTDSVIRFLSKAKQGGMAAATGAGVGGNACASNFESKETAEVVADAQIAGFNKLKSLGLTDVSQANKGQLIQVGEAMIDSIAAKLGVSKADANERFKNMCNQGCDVAGKQICDVAG